MDLRQLYFYNSSYNITSTRIEHQGNNIVIIPEIELTHFTILRKLITQRAFSYKSIKFYKTFPN